jgi:hypothetical protein
MVTEFERLNKCCSIPGCKRILIQGGIHMGIPFGRWPATKQLVCSKCYDDLTVKDNIQRTGEETI